MKTCNLKKTFIAFAALSAIAGAAQAQSSVTLYGRLDVGFGQTSAESTGAVPVASLSKTVVNSSLLNTTFWGLKGTEDLGGGLTANFDLQSQFSVDSGAAANTLFERQATVGLAGRFGSVNLGRQYTAYDSLRGATNNVNDYNFSTSGQNGLWKMGVPDYNNRVNNSIRYNTPVFGGVSGSVVYGLGENKTAVSDAESNISIQLKYANGPVLVGYAHQAEKQVTGGLYFTAVASTVTETRKYDLFGGSYDFGIAKLTGSYNQSKNGTLKDKDYQVGVSVPFGAAAVSAGYSHSNSKGAALDLDGKGFSLVGTYDLSKRTTLYAGYKATEIESGTAAITTAKASTIAAGVRHTF